MKNYDIFIYKLYNDIHNDKFAYSRYPSNLKHVDLYIYSNS